jgi:hypothetical protein
MRGQGVGANEAAQEGRREGRVPRYPAPSWTPSRPQGSSLQPTSRAPKRGGAVISGLEGAEL